MHRSKHFFKIIEYPKYKKWCHTEEKTIKQDAPKSEKGSKASHSRAINLFFRQNEHLTELKPYIPSKYLQLKRKRVLEHLYLISPIVAKEIVSRVRPLLDLQSDQIICETNAGLGLIATELLESGIKLIRLYESCPDFRQGLKDFGTVYPDRVELFTKDIFNLYRYAYMDKQDHANRVESMLKNVPKRSWRDEPVMTVIGTLPTLAFIRYMLKCLALQNDIVQYGRIQLFAIMKPRHYAVLTGSPKDNLLAYQSWTVLVNLFFECELLDKFPRNLFLPWESPMSKAIMQRYPASLEPDKMYLVRINFKKHLPVSTENLLPLYYFVRQFYQRGNNRVIPTLEKWVPGCGFNIILPQMKHAEYFEGIDIFTQFRELTPDQILSVFKEMINYPSYSSSPFHEMIENGLMKLETIETNLSEATQVEKNVSEEIEEKLNT